MMSEKLFRTNDLVKFDYSEIGEYVDENHTDRPLRNDEVCDLLNKQQATISQLEEENEQLRRLLKEKEQLITINLTEEDEKELRKLLGLVDDE